MKPSILPPQFRGLMYITGQRGIGKSFLAAQAENPALMAFWDFEEKGSGIDAQLHFGQYRAPLREVTEKLGPKFPLIELANWVEGAVEDLGRGRFTTLVIDNISPLESALGEVVRRDPERYGVSKRNAITGAFGGVHPGVSTLESGLFAQVHSQGVQLIIVTAHVSSRWGPGGPIPNKYSPKGNSRLQMLSILSLLLVPGESWPPPAAVVLKEQLGSISFPQEPTEEQIEAMRRGEPAHVTRRCLPARIPQCTFASIRRYLHHPADLEHPAPGETLIPEEVEPYSERLSREQIELVRLQTKLALQEQEAQEEMLSAGGEGAATAGPPTTWQELLSRLNTTPSRLGLSFKELRGLPPERIAEIWEMNK